MLLGLPLGTIYFTVIVTGVSLALGLMVLALIGIPITIALWYVNRAFMRMERGLAVGLLDEQIDAACAEEDFEAADALETERLAVEARLAALGVRRVRMRTSA